MRRTGYNVLVLLLCCAAVPAGESVARAETPTGATGFEADVQPLLAQYCYECHGEKQKGGLDLRLYPDERAAKTAREVFERVRRNLLAGEMPPAKKPQPAPVERERIAGWIESAVLTPVRPDPGRVTIRRLNRVEYRNTIRDLLGVEFQAESELPADDAGYGFDNIGDVLSLSPLLLEKYLAAAEKIVDAAVAADSAGSDAVRRLPGREAFSLDVSGSEDRDAAREIARRFAARAYRRPADPEEIDRLMQLFDSTRGSGESFESRMKVLLQAILISPHFLFRGELQPDADDPGSIHSIDEYALASRLSYFLWSSMPDDELFALAEKGRLRRDLPRQVKRMLRDSRSQALVDNFAGQWLQLRNLQLMTPDPGTFPGFDEELRAAMLRETELFFAHVMNENRSVLEFLDADYTFLNERLARHYGVAGVTGSGFRKVRLRGGERGGLLGQASLLTLTSNPTRTSPVKRGKWILETLLGSPPPPPPPEVPELPDSREAQLTGTLRQRMVQHRDDPNCSSCHARMDPLGFGLENYDAIGAWRERDGEFAVDASGELAGGETFEGAADLKRILMEHKREAFARCLTEKMLTYALGRGLEHYDEAAVNRIAGQLARERFRFASLIQGIVQSAPFQMRRGDGAAAESTSRGQPWMDAVQVAEKTEN